MNFFLNFLTNSQYLDTHLDICLLYTSDAADESTGGGFEINDPSSDLGVAISILSSLKNIPPLASSSFIGELGLSGQVRKSNNLRTKIEEAVRLGIKNIVVPKLEEELNNNFQNLINIKEISNIKEALDYSFSK